MGTHLIVLSESIPMNTNMIWFRWFSNIFASFSALGKSSLSIGRVNDDNGDDGFDRMLLMMMTLMLMIILMMMIMMVVIMILNLIWILSFVDHVSSLVMLHQVIFRKVSQITENLR